MTTLVTGATGLLGSAVVRKLRREGRSVRCLVQPSDSDVALQDLGVEIVYGDVTSKQEVRSAMDGVRVVYHLAAIYRLWLPNPAAIYKVNVEGTRNILFAAARQGVERVVHTSSIAAVGHHPGKISDEATRFNLWPEADHYIRSKWIAETSALQFACDGLPLVVVNPAFVFGAGDRAPTPTGRFVVDALEGRMPGYPPGGFNVVDVDDVAEAHLLAEKKGRVGERYILGNHNVSYRDFYRTVSEVAGLRPLRVQLPKQLIWAGGYIKEKIANQTQRPPQLTYKAARYASRNLFFDCRKAHNELDMPCTPLRETVEKSVRWFRDQGTG